MLHQKHKPFKYILSLKKWIHWIATRWGKNVVVSKMYKRAWKLKNILFLYLMRTFHNFALIIETTWVERVVKSILEKRNSYSSEYWGYLAHFAAPSLKKNKTYWKNLSYFSKKKICLYFGKELSSPKPKKQKPPWKKIFFSENNFSQIFGWLMIKP